MSKKCQTKIAKFRFPNTKKIEETKVDKRIKTKSFKI